MMNDSIPIRRTVRDRVELFRVTRFSTRSMRRQMGRLLIAGVAALGPGYSPGTLRADEKPLFMTHCAPCHGKDGKADTPMARKLGVKDLSQSKLGDSEIEKQIIEGKKNDRGVQIMPPFKEKLSSDQVKSIIAVVKSLRK
jgi:mono/diheme cytochrome c family protein